MSKRLTLNEERKKSIAFCVKFANRRTKRRLAELVEGRRFPKHPLEIYCPHEPWAKQAEFLALQQTEAFFGGAAAGGKSEALLMAALQYVDVPGYSALILRRDTQRLKLSGGLIPRSQEWFAGTNAHWNAVEKRWTFPTRGAPAVIAFGYLNASQDKYRYGSSEYQYIAFDELTEFPEEDYLYLFSRLRRTKRIAAPLRMRSASNPGNLGHDWVKRRFVAASDSEHRRFIPSRIGDNPAVDEAEYRANLLHLPPVERERLMNGDWNVRNEGLMRSEWLRYFDVHDRRIRLPLASSGGSCEFSFDACRRFITIDPAGTSAERAAERRGRAASWSVAAVWDQPRGKAHRHLLLRHVYRARVDFTGLCDMVRRAYAQWKPEKVFVEREKLGQALVDLLGRDYPLATISTLGDDKASRAAPLCLKLERGEFWLPSEPSQWRCEFETELLAWTGHPHETCDQIDAAAYAVREADAFGSLVRMEPVFRRTG